MGYAGINSENVKISNRCSILKLLNDHGPMSRKDIAVQLGLTPASVTLISMELITAGVLCEKGEVHEAKRAGRRKVWIDINHLYKFVLSASIEASEICIAICDLKGRCRTSKTIATDITKSPEQLLKEIANEGKSLLWEQGLGRDQILGMGVSIPGPVKRETGISQHAYRIWNDAVPIGQILQQELALPVIVENNVKSFAEGELIYGNGKQQENLLFVKWGPGVGSAIIIHNKIYDSHHSKTAEIGHYIVEPGGQLCRCGRKGCLETRVATHAIAEAVRNIFSKEKTPVLYETMEGSVDRIEANNITEWITVEDSGLERILDDIIERLARTVVNAITLLAPGKVILYGFMFDFEKIVLKFHKFCTFYDSAYDENYIVKSELSYKIGYIGPVAVVVNELFMESGNLSE